MKKSYVYANSQPLIQYDGSPKSPNTDIYFYLHDRLSSVRQVIDADGNVVNSYTYNPFGEDFAAEISEEIDNSFKFTGQYFDSEIGQYYLRARQYDPVLMRFTSIDPVKGKLKQPLTLHRYLYCANDPMNRTDLNGRFFGFVDLLVSSAIASNMRGNYTAFMKKVEGKALDWTKSFSQVNLERGAAMDFMVADINGELKSAAIEGGIKAIGLFSENLERLANVSGELWKDHEAIINILEEGSYGKLFDYGKGKLRKILLGELDEYIQ